MNRNKISINSGYVDINAPINNPTDKSSKISNKTLKILINTLSYNILHLSFQTREKIPLHLLYHKLNIMSTLFTKYDYFLIIPTKMIRLNKIKINPKIKFINTPNNIVNFLSRYHIFIKM